GRVSHWSSVTTTTMAVAPTMAEPSNRPTTRRRPASRAICSLVIGSAPEDGSASEDPEPQYQGDQEGQAPVDQGRGTHVGIDARLHEEPPGEDRTHDPDQRAQHPGREEGTDDVDLRSHRAGAGLAVGLARLR